MMGEGERLGRRGLERGWWYLYEPRWFAPRDEQVRYIVAIELNVVENRRLRITSAPLSENSAIIRPPCAPLREAPGSCVLRVDRPLRSRLEGIVLGIEAGNRTTFIQRCHRRVIVASNHNRNTR